MARCLVNSTLDALAEDPASIPSCHMAAHNCATPVPEDQMPSSDFCRNQAQMWCKEMHAGTIPIHEK